MIPDYDLLKDATPENATFMRTKVIGTIESTITAMNDPVPRLPMTLFRQCLAAQLKMIDTASVDTLVSTDIFFTPASESTVPEKVFVGSETADFIITSESKAKGAAVIRIAFRKERGDVASLCEREREREKTYRLLRGNEIATHGILVMVDVLAGTAQLWLITVGGRYEELLPGWE